MGTTDIARGITRRGQFNGMGEGLRTVKTDREGPAEHLPGIYCRGMDETVSKARPGRVIWWDYESNTAAASNECGTD
jgi:hypothetical protein